MLSDQFIEIDDHQTHTTNQNQTTNEILKNEIVLAIRLFCIELFARLLIDMSFESSQVFYLSVLNIRKKMTFDIFLN